MSRKHITNQKMKKINLSIVLNLIRRNESITRGQLAVQTGMTIASITNLIGELREKGYVELIDSGKSAGGRRPELIRLCPEAEYAVGLEMTTSQITCLIGNLQAEILARRSVPISVEDGRERIIDAMVDAVEEVVRASGVPRERISGLGLAVPGPCDYQNGVMLNPPNFPDWVRVPIRDRLAGRLRMKVFMCKETSCDGLAEYWFGRATGSERIFVTHIGMVGIGGAFVDQGDVFRSDTQETMDIGHNVVQADGYPCACGNRGCLEAQAHARAAVRYAREYAVLYRSARFQNPESIRLEDVLRGAEEGEACCVQAIERCAAYLSAALRNVILLLAPDRIFCGGGFVDRCPRLIEATARMLRDCRYPDCSGISLEPFSFGRENGAIGALAVVFSDGLD